MSERLIGEPLSAAGTPVTYAAVDALEPLIRASAPPGALVLMLGAGSISAAAHRFGAAIDAARRRRAVNVPADESADGGRPRRA